MSTEFCVRVALADRSYDIRIVSGRNGEFANFVQSSLKASWAGKSCRSAFLVTDQNVRMHSDVILESLTTIGLDCELAVIEPGEASKSFESARLLLDRLVERKSDRHTCVVPIGGGVIGDLAGYVAATYARGLPLIMVPTSLLAMVDSSVGGKVAINHPKAKNIIGAFHQPIAVWVDTATLNTLPEREVRCGLAEVVKYGMILDDSFFSDLEQSVEAVLALDQKTLRRVVQRSCELKANVVSKDEREETGLRAVLNFGHTIGHAIEAIAGYGGHFEHGEAVAVGMVAECRLAERIGWIAPDVTYRLIKLLKRCQLPVSAPGLSIEQMIDAMGRDKKNQAGKIRFVLPRRVGHVEMTSEVTPDQVRAVLSEMTQVAGFQ